MNEPTDLPAFPSTHADLACMGMTLRDYFAAQAMQACMQVWSTARIPETIAMHAYAHADAMLEERSRGK